MAQTDGHMNQVANLLQLTSTSILKDKKYSLIQEFLAASNAILRAGLLDTGKFAGAPIDKGFIIATHFMLTEVLCEHSIINDENVQTVALRVGCRELLEKTSRSGELMLLRD